MAYRTYDRGAYADKGAGGRNGAGGGFHMSLEQRILTHIDAMNAWPTKSLKSQIPLSAAAVFLRVSSVMRFTQVDGRIVGCSPDKDYDEFFTDLARHGIPVIATAKFSSQQSRRSLGTSSGTKRAEFVMEAFDRSSISQMCCRQTLVPRFNLRVLSEKAPIGLAVGYEAEDLSGFSHAGVSSGDLSSGLLDCWDLEGITRDDLKAWWRLPKATRDNLLEDWVQRVPSEAFS